MFDKIKGYYEKGLWELNRIRSVVEKAISREEYEKITGKKY